MEASGRKRSLPHKVMRLRPGRERMKGSGPCPIRRRGRNGAASQDQEMPRRSHSGRMSGVRLGPGSDLQGNACPKPVRNKHGGRRGFGIGLSRPAQIKKRSGIILILFGKMVRGGGSLPPYRKTGRRKVRKQRRMNQGLNSAAPETGAGFEARERHRPDDPPGRRPQGRRRRSRRAGDRRQTAACPRSPARWRWPRARFPFKAMEKAASTVA